MGLIYPCHLKDEQKKDLSPEKPSRIISTSSDETAKLAQQEGFNLKYKVLITEHHKRVNQLEENLTKVYALIFYTAACDH